jgi:diguanylate cyclase (GGDEF)-like protein
MGAIPMPLTSIANTPVELSSTTARGTGHLFWAVLSRIIVFAALDDVLLLLFFRFAGSPLLAWINIGSILIYVSSYCLLKRRWNRSALALIWIEVFTHTAIATVLTGWNSGFQYYLLMFVPTIIISAPRRQAVWMLTVLWSFYLGLLFAMQTFSPLQPISHRALVLLQAFNASILFVMVSYFTLMYRRLARASEQKLKLLAITDPLTGLFNRRHAHEMATHEANQGGRTGRPLSFILADIDHFKKINDQHGHEGGDMVLIAVSKALSGITRTQDILARWGGEEFLLVLPDTSREGAAELASRILHIMQDLRSLPDADMRVTMTIGISSQRRHEGYEAALARADRALYQGKHSGRNCVRLDLDESLAPVREPEPRLYYGCTQAA